MEEEIAGEGTETPFTDATGETEATTVIGEGERVTGEEYPGEGDLYQGEYVGAEHLITEELEGEGMQGEQMEGEHVEGEEKEKVLGEGEELMGEGEQLEGEHLEGEQKEVLPEEIVEEEAFVEEPPPDPAAPFNFSDSQEALKPKYELRPDQLAEVEQLWEVYQDHTPAYSDIDGYITVKELVYMLKSLLLMTYTEEQLYELITFCVRPPHPDGHITYEEFLKMVTLRQRDYPIEEELRAALQVLDPDSTGIIDREYFKETISKLGHKMGPKQLDYLVKEVDISNDGTIGIDDVVGTMCIDLNRDDIVMLMNILNPPEDAPEPEEF